MDSRTIPGLVLDEAADVLGELADWLRTAPYCPSCLSRPGCSTKLVARSAASLGCAACSAPVTRSGAMTS